MEKLSTLSIKPNDSSQEDFVLSLSDYFCKEFNNRGLQAKRNQSYVTVALPQLYKDKYHSVIVDCSDGFVYLRGNECKDKKFGKLSKYNPQRKSDAYNCVNYNITRLVNRINNLDYGICDLRTASLVIAEEVIDMIPEQLEQDQLEQEQLEQEIEPEIIEYVLGDIDDIQDGDIVIIEEAPMEIVEDVPDDFITLEEVPEQVDDFVVLEEEPVPLEDDMEIIVIPDDYDLEDIISLLTYDDDYIDLNSLDSDYTLDRVEPEDILEVESKRLDSNITQKKEKEFLDQHPDLKDYGELRAIYNNFATFEKQKEFSDQEVKDFCESNKDIIIDKFSKSYGEKKSNLELNDDIVVLFCDNLYNCEYSQNFQQDDYEGIPGKIFFKVYIKGYEYQDVDFNGNVINTSLRNDDNGIFFEYTGEKS